VKLSETAVFLGKAALIDNRTVGEADVAAWHELIGDLPLRDCMAALAEHRKAGAEWLMPSHIIARVRDIRRARLVSAGTAPIPAGLTQDQERAWVRSWCAAVKDGSPDPVAEANAGAGGFVEIEGPARPDRVAIIRELAERKGIA